MIRRRLRALIAAVRAGRLLACHGVLDPLVASPDVPMRGLLRLGIRLAGARRTSGLAAALERAGPSYVKLGQFLASRTDFLTPELREELAALHDRMPAFPQSQAEAIVVRSLGAPLSELFRSFGPAAAAASGAQVHFAQLPDGREVAVKILRPGIAERFAQDLAGFDLLARVGEVLLPSLRRLRPRAVLGEVRQWVTDETDLRTEAAVASEFDDNLSRDDDFYIPEVFWSHTSRDILTAERIRGIPLSDLPALRASGLDLPAAAARLIAGFLRHATRDGLFHGDMHPGNLFLLPDGTIAAVDFGVTGTLDDATRRTMAQILYGFVTRDYARIARAHLDAGYLPADACPVRFARALRTVGEPIFGRRARDISMGRLLGRLFAVTERFNMSTRPELVLLQRTMLTVEGTARMLDPDLDLWQTARPVLEAWMRRETGPREVLRRVAERFRVW